TGSKDGIVRLWDTALGQQVGPDMSHFLPVKSVGFDTSGELLLTAGRDGQAVLWKRSTGEAIQRFGHGFLPPSVYSADISRDGKYVATGSGRDWGTGEARVWDAATGQLLVGPLAHDGAVRAVALTPDGTHLATGSEDLKARLWDLQ